MLRVAKLRALWHGRRAGRHARGGLGASLRRWSMPAVLSTRQARPRNFHALVARGAHAATGQRQRRARTQMHMAAAPPATPTRLPPLKPLAPQDLMWCKLPGPAPLPTGVLSFAGRVPHSTAVAFLQDKLFAVPAFARQLQLKRPRGDPRLAAGRRTSKSRATCTHHQLDCA